MLILLFLQGLLLADPAVLRGDGPALLLLRHRPGLVARHWFLALTFCHR